MEDSRLKTGFWISTGLLAFVLIVLISVALETIGLALGHRGWGGQVGAVAFPCLMLSAWLVIVLYRRRGLLAEEQTVETLRRLPTPIPVTLDSSVEIRMPRSSWLSLALVMDFAAVLIFIVVLTLPAVPGTKPAGYDVALGFALFSLGPWYGYGTRAGVTARVDRKGIRGDGVGPKSSAGWSEIATCDIVTVPLPWGRFTRYEFRDSTDKILIRLTLSTKGSEQERFHYAVRECFC